MKPINKHNANYFRDSVTLGASLILFNPYIIYTMNHYYLYIDAGRVIDSTAKFYKGGAPSARIGQRDLHIRPISARELVRNMRGHVVDPVPNFVLHNQNHMRHFFNVNYRVSSSFRRR